MPLLGVRAVPLRPDAARRRCDGKARSLRAAPAAPVVPLLANVAAEALHRACRHSRQPGRAGHGHRALARKHAHGLARGDALVEIGAGKVLTGMVKRIARSQAIVNVGVAGRNRSFRDSDRGRARMTESCSFLALVP